MIDFATYTNTELAAVDPATLGADDLQNYREEMQDRGLSAITPPTVPTAPDPPGTPGVAEFVFATAAATWLVVHGLDRRPLVSTLTDDGYVFDADVEYPDLSTVVITHAVPTAGSVLIV